MKIYRFKNFKEKSLKLLEVKAEYDALKKEFNTYSEEFNERQLIIWEALIRFKEEREADNIIKAGVIIRELSDRLYPGIWRRRSWIRFNWRLRTVVNCIDGICGFGKYYAVYENKKLSYYSLKKPIDLN